MMIAVVTLLIVISVVVIALPFFSRRSRGAGIEDEAAEIAHRLRRARDRVYEEIRTLQQEYFLKNVSEEEYRAQLQEARLRAANLARQQHEIQQTLHAVEQAVDTEIAEVTSAGTADQPEHRLNT